MKKKTVKRKAKKLFEIPMSSARRWLECGPTCIIENRFPIDAEQKVYETKDCEAAEVREGR